MSVILTPRLALRHYTPDDLPALWRVLRDPLVVRQMNRFPPNCSEEYAQGFLMELCMGAQEGWRLEFAVTHRATGAFLGSCGFVTLSETHRRGELAYFFAPEARGKGCAREAVAAVRDWGAEHLRLQRVSARCFADNRPSRRLLEALDFQLEGVARREILRDGVFEDVCQYAWLS